MMMKSMSKTCTPSEDRLFLDLLVDVSLLATVSVCPVDFASGFSAVSALIAAQKAWFSEPEL